MDFSSKGCASRYNLQFIPPKTRKQRHCQYCGKPLQGKRQRACPACNPNIADRSLQTIGDIQKSAKYQVRALLRTVARDNYRRSERPRVCQNCGYDKHIEICHIRAIKEFPEDTPVFVVSGIDNLIALCPNCHWELDHGVLRYEDIPAVME